MNHNEDNFEHKVSLMSENDKQQNSNIEDSEEEFDTVSNKISVLDKQKLVLDKVNAQSGSTMATNLTKNGSWDLENLNLAALEMKISDFDEINYLKSPQSKIDYQCEDIDEHLKGKKLNTPRKSTSKSPSWRPSSKYFVKNNKNESKNQLSFVDKVKEYHNNKNLNTFQEISNEISPSTKPENEMRKISCFSCKNQKTEENFKIPKNRRKKENNFKTESELKFLNKFNFALKILTSFFLEMNAYLEKVKNMNMKSFSPQSKMDSSVHSILECINEEDSNDEKKSDDWSAYTADPRMFTKNQFNESFPRSSTMKNERPRYSILAKRINHDEFFQKSLVNKRCRSSLVQPKQQYLKMKKKYKGKIIDPTHQDMKFLFS